MIIPCIPGSLATCYGLNQMSYRNKRCLREYVAKPVVDLATFLESSRCHFERLNPKKSSRRRSVSMPSSPLMTYRSDDVIVQKVTSRTPEAERKLVDQVVTKKNRLDSLVFPIVMSCNRQRACYNIVICF